MKTRIIITLASLIFSVITVAAEVTLPSNFDQYFKTMDEATKIEKEVLQTPEKTVGPLLNVYICVSSNVAANKLSEQMQKVISKSIVDAFSAIPFGKNILEELVKSDPNFLNFDLEKTPYMQDCHKQLSLAYNDSRIPKEALRAIIRLAELGGAFLGKEITSGL